MSQPLKLQYSLFGQVGGDVWPRADKADHPKMRTLVSQAAQANTHPGVSSVEARLHVEDEFESLMCGLNRGTTIFVNENTVKYFGPNPNARISVGGVPTRPSLDSAIFPSSNGFRLLTDGNEIITDEYYGDVFFPGRDNVTHVIPEDVFVSVGFYLLETEIQPPSIISKTGRIFFAGSDYALHPEGLLFNENPSDLLGESVSTIWEVEPRRSILEYATACGELNSGAIGIVDYARQGVTPKVLTRALCNVAGFHWLENDDTVLSVNRTTFGIAYELEKVGRVTIAYPHIAYVPGQAVYGGRIFGDTIVVDGAVSGADTTWYTDTRIETVAFDDFLPPLPWNVSLNNSTRPYTATGADLVVSGALDDATAADEASFWQWLRAQEVSEDKSFGTSAGFTTPGETREFNLVTELLKFGGWQNWLFIKTYEWRNWSEEAKANVKAFAARYKLAGTVFLRVDNERQLDIPI